MSPLEAIKIALGAIWAHKLRSFLTLLGIIIGVAAVILVVMGIEGFNAYFNDRVADLGSNAFYVSKFGMITSWDDFLKQSRRNKDVTFEDVEAILNNPRRRYVRDAAAEVSTMGQVKLGAQTLQDVRIYGVTHNMIEIDKKEVAEGRYISREEEERSRFVCFIGWDVAKEFFESVDPIDKEIKIAGLPFRVVGVGEEQGTVFGLPRDNYVIIPITTFQKVFSTRRTIGIRVSATGPLDINNAVDEVRVVLRSRRHLGYSEEDNFGILTSEGLMSFRDKMVGTIQMATIGVASIALLVGGIVIMNIMLVSVTERTREVGIRKSVGARRQDILLQFLYESITLALIGGSLGILLAYGLGKLASTLLHLPLNLPLGWTAAAVLISAGVGLFSGVYPAYKAATLDPVEALRAE
jgi:putative ABC transport system permease protein